MRLTDDQAARLDNAIIRLRSRDKSVNEIARLVKLDPRSVYRRLAAMRDSYEHIRNRRPA